MISICL